MAKAKLEVKELIAEVRGLISGYVDIRDGSNGVEPLPNDAMRATQLLDELEAALADSGPMMTTGIESQVPMGQVLDDPRTWEGLCDEVPLQGTAGGAADAIQVPQPQLLAKQEPWGARAFAYVIETPGGDMYDGEYAVFSDESSCRSHVEDLNDEIDEGQSRYKVIPLYRAAGQAASGAQRLDEWQVQKALDDHELLARAGQVMGITARLNALLRAQAGEK